MKMLLREFQIKQVPITHVGISKKHPFKERRETLRQIVSDLKLLNRDALNDDEVFESSVEDYLLALKDTKMITGFRNDLQLGQIFIQLYKDDVVMNEIVVKTERV